MELNFLLGLLGLAIFSYLLHRYQASRLGLSRIREFLAREEEQLQVRLENKIAALEDVSDSLAVDLKEYRHLKGAVQHRFEAVKSQQAKLETVTAQLEKMRLYYEGKQATILKEVSMMEAALSELSEKQKLLSAYQEQVGRFPKQLADLDVALFNKQKALEERFNFFSQTLKAEVESKTLVLQQEQEKQYSAGQLVLEKQMKTLTAELQEATRSVALYEGKTKEQLEEKYQHALSKLNAGMEEFTVLEREKIKDEIALLQEKFTVQTNTLEQDLDEQEKRQRQLKEKQNFLEQEIQQQEKGVKEKLSLLAEEILKRLREKVSAYQEELSSTLQERYTFFAKATKTWEARLDEREENWITKADLKFKGIEENIDSYKTLLAEEVESITKHYKHIEVKVLEKKEKALARLTGRFESLQQALLEAEQRYEIKTTQLERLTLFIAEAKKTVTEHLNNVAVFLDQRKAEGLKVFEKNRLVLAETYENTRWKLEELKILGEEVEKKVAAELRELQSNKRVVEKQLAKKLKEEIHFWLNKKIEERFTAFSSESAVRLEAAAGKLNVEMEHALEQQLTEVETKQAKLEKRLETEAQVRFAALEQGEQEALENNKRHFEILLQERLPDQMAEQLKRLEKKLFEKLVETQTALALEANKENRTVSQFEAGFKLEVEQELLRLAKELRGEFSAYSRREFNTFEISFKDQLSKHNAEFKFEIGKMEQALTTLSEQQSKAKQESPSASVLNRRQEKSEKRLEKLEKFKKEFKELQVELKKNLLEKLQQKTEQRLQAFVKQYEKSLRQQEQLLQAGKQQKNNLISSSLEKEYKTFQAQFKGDWKKFLKTTQKEIGVLVNQEVELERKKWKATLYPLLSQYQVELTDKYNLFLGAQKVKLENSFAETTNTVSQNFSLLKQEMQSHFEQLLGSYTEQLEVLEGSNVKAQAGLKQIGGLRDKVEKRFSQLEAFIEKTKQQIHSSLSEQLSKKVFSELRAGWGQEFKEAVNTLEQRAEEKLQQLVLSFEEQKKTKLQQLGALKKELMQETKDQRLEFQTLKQELKTTAQAMEAKQGFQAEQLEETSHALQHFLEQRSEELNEFMNDVKIRLRDTENELQEHWNEKTLILDKELSELVSRLAAFSKKMEVLVKANEISEKLRAEFDSYEKKLGVVKERNAALEELLENFGTVQERQEGLEQLDQELSEKRVELCSTREQLEAATALAGEVEVKLRLLEEQKKTVQHFLSTLAAEEKRMALFKEELAGMEKFRLQLEEAKAMLNNLKRESELFSRKKQELVKNLGQRTELLSTELVNQEELRKQLSIQFEKMEAKSALFKANFNKLRNFENSYRHLDLAILDMEKRKRELEQLRRQLLADQEKFAALKQGFNEQIAVVLKHSYSKKELTFPSGEKLEDTIFKLKQIGWSAKQIATQLQLEVPEVELLLKNKN